MDRIKFRQFLMILFLITLSGKMFMLPSYMMRLCGQDSLAVMVIDCLLDIVILVVVLLIMRSGTGTLFETLTYAFGKLTARIVAVVLAVFYTVKLFNMLTEIRVFFSSTVLSVPISPLHLLPLLLILMFVAGKKLEVVGRAATIIAPLVLVSMILLGGLSLPSINFTNLLPIFKEPRQITNGLMSFPMWFGDFLLLLLYTGKTDSRKRIYFALIAAVIVMLIIILFTAMMFSLYAYIPDVLTYGHNISGMTQYSVASFKYGRFDLLIFCMWTLGVLVTASVTVTMINRCCNFVIGRDIGLYTSMAGCVILVAAQYVFDNSNEICDFMTTYLAVPGLIIQNGLPVILLIAIKIKKLIESKKKTPGGAYDEIQAQFDI